MHAIAVVIDGDRVDPVGSVGSVTATYTDAITPVVTIDPATGTVVDLKSTSVRSAVVTSSTGQTFPVPGLSTTESSATDGAVAAQLAAAADITETGADHQVLGEVIPGLLTVFALILLAFGLPHLLRRRRPPAATVPPPEPSEHLVGTAASSRRS